MSRTPSSRDRNRRAGFRAESRGRRTRAARSGARGSAPARLRRERAARTRPPRTGRLERRKRRRRPSARELSPGRRSETVRLNVAPRALPARARSRRGTVGRAGNGWRVRPPAPRKAGASAGIAPAARELGQQPRKLILDDVGERADDQQRRRGFGLSAGSVGTSAARHESSPSVNVVSTPEPV